MNYEEHTPTGRDRFHAKWTVIAAILGAIAGASVQYFVSRDVTDAKLLELSQDLAKERSRSDKLELQLQEMKSPPDIRRTRESRSGNVSSAHNAGAGPAQVASAEGSVGDEPPELRLPVLPAADYSASCGEKTIDLPEPHTGTSFPEGIVGVSLLVKPDECWTNVLRGPQNLKPWSVEGTAPIRFKYYYTAFGVGSWSNDEVIQPGRRISFDGRNPWEVIRFMNTTGEPAVATVTFYGN